MKENARWWFVDGQEIVRIEGVADQSG